MLGAAHKQHRKSIIYRREFPQLAGLEERARELLAGRWRFNEQKHRGRVEDGRMIEFGAVEKVNDVNKYQGRPHDLIGFDELCHFTEYQFRFLQTWNRTTRAGQRCRVIATFNPPTDAEGDWVIKYFGPWLDKRHTRPAKPGELRWYVSIAGDDVEVRNGNPFEWVYEDGTREWVVPKSRTFFPSRVEDNPYLMDTGYKATLQALPEPLRSLMLKGSFEVAQEDHPWQVIPTKWIEAAQARWRPLSRAERGPMSQLGVDVARGGRDKTTYAPRYGTWFAEVIKKPGKQTPDGQTVVRDILDVLGDERARVHADAIGVGSSVIDIGRMNSIDIVPMVASGKSFALDRSGRLRFANKRAEWIWKLREMLDPDGPTGKTVALPPGRETLADLSAARYEFKVQGITIESKEDIKDRIKRSPDVGEAIINAVGVMNDQVVLAGAIVVTAGQRNIPGQAMGAI